MKNSVQETLSAISDADLFQHCTQRLMKNFKSRNGWNFRYGHFQWVIHNGTLVQIDDCPKDRSFSAQPKQGEY